MLLTSLLCLIPYLQPMSDLRKRWSSHRLLVPAFHHQRVNGTRTNLRTWQQLTGTHHADHLLVAISIVWLHTKGHTF